MGERSKENALITMTNEDYWKIAEGFLYKHCYYLASDPDAIGEIVTELLKADTKFNGKGNINGYRKQCMYWKMCKLTKRRQDISLYSIPTHILAYNPTTPDLREDLEFRLTQIPFFEAECIRRFFLEQERIFDIGQILQLKKSTVYKYINLGLEHLRKLYVKADIF